MYLQDPMPGVNVHAAVINVKVGKQYRGDLPMSTRVGAMTVDEMKPYFAMLPLKQYICQ